MALSYLLDEHLRGGALWQAILQHNAGGIDVLDVLRVGDPGAPPLGTADPDLLLWAEANGRVLLSLDRRTLPGYFMQHLQAGHHSPGVLILRPARRAVQIVAALLSYDQLPDPQALRDRIEYIP